MLEELATVRTETVHSRRGQRAVVLLTALAVLVCIALGGRWILTRSDPVEVAEESAAHLGYVGRDGGQIYLSLDLQPVTNTSDDPVLLKKAELLPAAGAGGSHWAQVVDVRVLAGDLSTEGASGSWPEDGGQTAGAPPVEGYTIPPGEQVRLLFIVQLPDLKRSDDVSVSISQSWNRLLVSYEKDGDPSEVEAPTSVEVCIPSVTACQNKTL